MSDGAHSQIVVADEHDIVDDGQSQRREQSPAGNRPNRLPDVSIVVLPQFAVEQTRGTDKDAHDQNRTNLVEYLVHDVLYGIG